MAAPNVSSKTACGTTTSHATADLQSLLSSSTIASTHTRTNSTHSTNTSISEISDKAARGLEQAVGASQIIVEEIVVADAKDLTIASADDGPKMEVQREQDLGKNTTVVQEHVVRPVRPSLANARSSSFFDVREGDSTPRRWRRKMDRNAMANPGASVYIPNDS